MQIVIYRLTDNLCSMTVNVLFILLAAPQSENGQWEKGLHLSIMGH